MHYKMKRANNILLAALVFIIIYMSMLSALAMDQDAQKRIKDLSKEITRHDYLYYVLGKPEISDREYDQLFDELLRLEKEFPDFVLPDSPTKRVGSELDNSFPHVQHEIPMLSLEKCHSPKEVISWAKKTQEKAGEKLSFTVEEKIDGTGIELVYENGFLVRALTRGNGRTGYDVTNNARTVRAIPLKLNKPVSITVRGEVFIRKSDFHRLASEKDSCFGNARNLAAGALRRKQSSETAKIPLDIFVFEAVSGDIGDKATHAELLVFLKDIGFKTNPGNRTFANLSTLKKYIENAGSQRESCDYETDGVVLKVSEKKIRKLLGSTDRFPKWAIAYKFRSPENKTIVEQIEVRIGRLGRATPVAKLFPVRISRATITSATLHNQDYVSQLELAVGDTVEISRRGNVIPGVDRVVEKNAQGNDTWQMPAQCPVCKTPLETKGRHHFCPSPECPGRIRARLIYFSRRMGIRYLGPKTIDSLISHKQIKHPEDIYTLDSENLKALKGFGKKKISKLMASIEQSKARTFRDVFSALGIEGLGTGNIKILANAGFDSADKIFKAGTDRLARVKGIGPGTAQKIVRGFSPRLRKTVKALKKAGLNI